MEEKKKLIGMISTKSNKMDIEFESQNKTVKKKTGAMVEENQKKKTPSAQQMQNYKAYWEKFKQERRKRRGKK